MIPDFNISVNLFLTIGKAVQFSRRPMPFVFHWQSFQFRLKFYESGALFSKEG